MKLFIKVRTQRIMEKKREGYHSNGADGETRTPTPVKALAPEASVSTNSTTSAF